MSVLSIVIPTRNRARYLERAIASLLVALEPVRSEVEIAVFDNHSTDDTPEVCTQILREHACVRYQRHAAEACSAEQSTYFALRALAEAGTSEFFWVFGDDDVAAPDACADILWALRGGHDFVLASLALAARDPVQSAPASSPYYEIPPRGAHYDFARDLFMDFGVVTATTTLSCLAGRLECLDLGLWQQLLEVSHIYSHSLTLLVSYAHRPALALGGAQVLYSSNAVADELGRLRASGLLANQATYGPYSEGLLGLLEVVEPRLRGEAFAWQDVEEIHLDKQTWRLVHGTLFGFLLGMYATQALLYLDSGEAVERPSLRSVQRLEGFLRRHASGWQRDVGLTLCALILDLEPAMPEDRESVADALRAVHAMDALEMRLRIARAPDRTLFLTQNQSMTKPLRGVHAGSDEGEPPCGA